MINNLLNKFRRDKTDDFYSTYQKALDKDPKEALQLLQKFVNEHPSNKAACGELGRLTAKISGDTDEEAEDALINGLKN